MRARDLVFAAGLVASASSHGADLAYRGLAVGTQVSAEQLQNTLDLINPCGEGAIGLVCNGRVYLGPSAADLNAVIAPNGTLQRLNFVFDSDDFTAVAQTATNQWGKPAHVKKSLVQNAFGASFEQIEMIWIAPGGVQAELTYRAGSIKKSVLYISTAEDRKLFAKPAAKAL